MSKKRIPLTPERRDFLLGCPVVHVADAEQIYQVGRNRLYDYMKSGELKFTKLGGATLLHTDSLKQLVLDPKVEATA